MKFLWDCRANSRRAFSYESTGLTGTSKLSIMEQRPEGHQIVRKRDAAADCDERWLQG